MPQYECGTGNCKYEPIITIAAQSRCLKTTDQLRTRCKPCDANIAFKCSKNCTVRMDDRQVKGYQVPGAATLSYLTGVDTKPCEPNYDDHTTCKASNSNDYNEAIIQPLSVSASIGTPPRDYLDRDERAQKWPLIDYIVIENSREFLETSESRFLTHETRFVATQCEIVFGLQAVQDFVINATYRSNEIGFWRYGDPPANATSNATHSSWWMDLTTKAASKGDAKSAYVSMLPSYQDMHNGAHSISALIARIFSGRILATMVPTPQGLKTRLHKIGHPSSDSDDTALYPILMGQISGCQSDADYLNCAVNNVAKAITKTFRDDAHIAYGNDASNVTTTAGDAYITISYVRIDWWWISLPISIWLMSYVILVGTMTRTRTAGLPVWTNNILPLLYLYSESGDEGEAKESRFGISSKGYNRRAERSRMRLHVVNETATFK